MDLDLPSPEPLKRVVPLDLFPTQIIESSVVQKTYSADMPGEFGGGIIEINTKAVPSERILDISFSSGFNSETSLDDGLLYDGGDDDILVMMMVQEIFRHLLKSHQNNKNLIGPISKLIN